MNKRDYYGYEIIRIEERIEFREEEIEENRKRIKESEEIIKIAKENIQTYKDVRADLITLCNKLDEHK
ncbi:hypothetical protein RM652_12490 [Mammaliicoccus sciuri]|uniref:hypothetical protein n=1 Tax=Mammaliicoccus sciuri TaxID=1296 RepID=UPI001AEBFE8E|nr:hypothetical protein [Mammaliicoccus sciuri]MDT0703941.1 hypothetical protein [Mammaliicoccus sciuri]